MVLHGGSNLMILFEFINPSILKCSPKPRQSLRHSLQLAVDTKCCTLTLILMRPLWTVRGSPKRPKEIGSLLTGCCM